MKNRTPNAGRIDRADRSWSGEENADVESVLARGVWWLGRMLIIYCLKSFAPDP
jgi:hypothetical protein